MIWMYHSFCLHSAVGHLAWSIAFIYIGYYCWYVCNSFIEIIFCLPFSLAFILTFFHFFSIRVHIWYHSISVSDAQLSSQKNMLPRVVPPASPSTQLASYVVIITALSTTFPTLHATSLQLYRNSQFVLLNPFTLFTQPLNAPPHRQLLVRSLYVWVCFYFVCLFCSLESTYEIIWYLYLSFWLISPSIIPFMFIRAITKGMISPFYIAEEYSIV